MRGQVIIASLLMLTVSLAGCITDSIVGQTTDETLEQTTMYTISATDSLGDGGHVITVTHSDGSSLCSIGTYSTYWGDSWPDASCTFALSSGTATVSYESGETDYFQLTVTLTTPSGTTSDISPTASFGPEILAFLPLTEVWGCLDASSLNYDVNATKSSGLCLSEEQLLLAEEVFWSSWDSDSIDNATGPVGYRLMIEETSEDENESRSLDIQEVFSSDYYDQKILLRNIHEGAHEASHIIQQQDGCRDAASSLGLIDEIKEDDRVEFDECHYSSQTVFDNLVQVEKYSGEEWDNYSMDTASTYDEFRNRLEHGPGIRDDSGDNYEAVEETETVARSEDGGPGDCNDSRTNVRPCGFPSVADTEFESIEFKEPETLGGGSQQTIYYFAKDTSTGTEIEVMGVMTEDGFKITEYCNEIHNTDVSIIDSFMRIPVDVDGDGDDELSRGTGGHIHGYFRVSARIILLEVVDANEMRFEEYDYTAPIEYGLMHMKAIPFYFEGISDEDTNESENKSAQEGRKGLNAVNVKVVIAGPSGPYGMEGDLSDYRLVISNCTLDNKTIGLDETSEADNMTRDDETSEADNSTKADEEDTSARSEGTNGSDEDRNDVIYGSAGNSCTDLLEYDLPSAGIDSVPYLSKQEITPNGGGPSIIFVDADLSGTLSEGDRFEFSDNNTIFDDANMVRLFSISADEYSDGNIDPSSEMSSMHQGAMNAIRNIRAVVPDDPAPPVRAVDHNSTRSNSGT